MADYFDPSPRASKRRRTTTYKTSRSVLQEKENMNVALSNTDEVLDQTSEPQNAFEDSTYGSKEDSLIEGAVSVLASPTAPDIGDAADIENIEGQERNASGAKGRRASKEITPPPDNIESENEEADNSDAKQPRSSGRQRKRPRRYSMSPEKPKLKSKGLRTVQPEKLKQANTKRGSAAAVKAQPKGILTPTRKEKRTGSRKSVVFDHNEKIVEENLGFRDIDRSTGKAIQKSNSLPEATMSEDELELSLTPSKRSKQKSAVSIESQSKFELEREIGAEFDDLLIQPSDEVDFEIPLTEHNEVDRSTLDEDPLILAIKAEVCQRLVSRGTTQVPSHLQSQYDTLHALLNATITSGESNSLLLLGARGTGKTHLLEAAITDLTTKYTNDFHTIRLNGFFQTDDKVALREIWRQLGREMQVNEMETGETGGSYADTMNSLLSLLSHPDELFDETAMDVDIATTRTSKSVVFILDEFDLFTTHPRQTLLYNLFDIAQSKKAPIAVIGCSTRMDVVDCLEKRVKSRFSHRWLHIPSAKTLDDLGEIIGTALTTNVDGPAALNFSRKEMEARKKWNDHIQSVFLSSTQVQSLIKRTFYTNKSIPDLLTALYMPIATLELSRSTLAAEDKDVGTISIPSQPTLLLLLPSLPSLHLALLVAASRLDTIHNLTTLNFNLVYAHYVELISRSKVQVTASGAVAVGASLRQWSRETAQSAWEDLGMHDCIVPASGGSAGAGHKDTVSVGCDNAGGEGASTRMWRVDVTLEELSWAIQQKWKESGGVRDVLSKWCREI